MSVQLKKEVRQWRDLHMKIFNSLTRKKEEFKPIKKGIVGIYVCGPTVYDVAHLGHARAAVSFDIVRRYFVYKDLRVIFVSNVTDVDDKMIKRAHEQGISEAALAAKIIPEYKKDYDALNILPPDYQPRATEYIPKMVVLIENLMKKGAAYATQNGIYFEVEKFKDYGKLSGKNIDELQAGARIEIDKNKRNPADFALWKSAKQGEPEWVGPGKMRGRPGWHIECSAMSMDLLGETFDIHGGGIDLIFPHHEDELTQSEMATGKPFARYWMHNGHIRVNSEKMSKSLGNFFTVKEILEKYNPLVVRYFLIGTQYRMPIEFSDDLLGQAKSGLERLHDFMRRLKGEKAVSKDNSKELSALTRNTKKGFEAAMDDDFEISQALAAIFDFVKGVNVLLDAGVLSQEDIGNVIDAMNSFDGVLAILGDENGKGCDQDGEIAALIEERNLARKNKDFARADEIRKELDNKGIILEDKPSGTVWKKAL